MHEQLTFLLSAVTDKPLNDVLKNIHISNGVAQTGNGRITALAHINALHEVEACVNATKFIRAVLAGSQSPDIRIEKTMSVRNGKFAVRLGLEDASTYPTAEVPDNIEPVQCTGFTQILSLLRPFIGDAGKTAQWSCGIQLANGSAYATNNIVLIKAEMDVPFEDHIILPVGTVDALLKINEDPVGAWTDGKQAWFEFSGSRWLHTVLVDSEWPDVDSMLQDTAVELPRELHTDIKQLVPFCEDSDMQTIFLSEDKITTKEGNSVAELEGYSIGNAAFRARPLISVLQIATHADFSTNHVPFKGPGFQGVLVGLR